MAAVFDTREQEIVAGVKELCKELQKLSAAPPETESPEALVVRLPILVRPNDEHLQLLVTDAFANSKWKKIRVYGQGEESYHQGQDETTLFNAVFRGAQNSIVEELLVVTYTEDNLHVSIPGLPPNLRKLELSDFNLLDDVEDNRTGLPELIRHHKHLKYLKLRRCDLSPEALGMALCVNEGVKHLILEKCECNMKDFFNSVDNRTLQTLELHNFKFFTNEFRLGVSGIEAMHKALNGNRLALEKLELVCSIRNSNEAHAVARTLDDYKMTKELDLSGNAFGKDGLKDILASLRNTTGLWSLDLSETITSATSMEMIKAFVKSRPDGTLERVCVEPHLWNRDARTRCTQEEIDTLLDMNKLKPLIRECQGVPLSVLQHKRLDCRYFYIRSKPEVLRSQDDVEEPPRKRPKTRHNQTSSS